MVLLNGKISKITDSNTHGYKKKILELKHNNSHVSFIEFRQPSITSLLNEFKAGDSVTIAVDIVGKKSIKSGVNYNNLIAKAIKKM